MAGAREKKGSFARLSQSVKPPFLYLLIHFFYLFFADSRLMSLPSLVVLIPHEPTFYYHIRAHQALLYNIFEPGSQWKYITPSCRESLHV